jgi:hypothetical protein
VPGQVLRLARAIGQQEKEEPCTRPHLDRVHLVEALRLDQLVGLGAREAGNDFEGEGVVLRLAVGRAVLLVGPDGGEGCGTGDGLVSEAALVVAVLDLVGGLLVAGALEAKEKQEARRRQARVGPKGLRQGDAERRALRRTSQKVPWLKRVGLSVVRKARGSEREKGE